MLTSLGRQMNKVFIVLRFCMHQCFFLLFYSGKAHTCVNTFCFFCCHLMCKRRHLLCYVYYILFVLMINNYCNMFILGIIICKYQMATNKSRTRYCSFLSINSSLTKIFPSLLHHCKCSQTIIIEDLYFHTIDINDQPSTIVVFAFLV